MVYKTMPALFLCLFMKRVLGLAFHAVILQFNLKNETGGVIYEKML